MRIISCLLLTLIILSCKKEVNTDPLRHILASSNQSIRAVMDNSDKYELQIQLTETNTTRTHSFRVNDDNYFYPASTVKFPIAILALEKVNRLDSITSTTPFLVEGDSILTTIRDCVTKIFAVSDNDAYNKLYEFLGRNYINSKLKEKGLQPARISHRLSTADAQNPDTKPLIFNVNDTTYFQQESMNDSRIETLKLNRLLKGRGFYKGDTLIQEAMDFSEKNYIPISTLNEMMTRIQFPENYTLKEQFNLNNEDYEFLLKTMTVLPRDVGYDERDYYDGYVKFFLYGDTKDRIPDYMKISNKVGYAYGYLTDCAFIEDTKHDISFILTATIHVNENGIFNDDVYEYDTIGVPFLAELGRQVYTYYLKNQSTD